MVTKSYSEQFNLIKKDIRKSYDGIVNDMSREAKKDLDKAATDIIYDFYNSRIPDYYIRTDNFKTSLIKNSITKYGQDNGKMAYVVLSSIPMDELYHAEKDFVFDVIWNRGIRGLPGQNLQPKWYPHVMIDNKLMASKTPDLLMTQFVRNWCDKIGSKKINNIDKKYISNKYISF